MSASLRRLAARLGRWPRVLAVTTCLLLALASALGSARGRAHPRAAPAGPTSAVVVAARPLASGHVLARGDLTVVRWPRALVPAGTLDGVTGAVGARLAGPLGTGEAITRTRLVGSGLSTGLGAGSVAATVTVDSDVHAFVRAGDQVDLLAVARPDTDATAPSARAVVLAQRLVVLAVYAGPGDTTLAPTSELVVAASRTLALQIAGLRSIRDFSVVGDPS